MIKHVVMWTISEGDTPRSKVENMAEVKVRLLSLKDKIDEIVSLDVYSTHFWILVIIMM